MVQGVNKETPIRNVPVSRTLCRVPGRGASSLPALAGMESNKKQNSIRDKKMNGKTEIGRWYFIDSARLEVDLICIPEWYHTRPWLERSHERSDVINQEGKWCALPFFRWSRTKV